MKRPKTLRNEILAICPEVAIARSVCVNAQLKLRIRLGGVDAGVRVVLADYGRAIEVSKGKSHNAYRDVGHDLHHGAGYRPARC
jgi:hypothetical protein